MSLYATSRSSWPVVLVFLLLLPALEPTQPWETGGVGSSSAQLLWDQFGEFSSISLMIVLPFLTSIPYEHLKERMEFSFGLKVEL